MTEEELLHLVQTISWQYFKKPFTHQVKLNKRFKTTGGRYHLDDHHLEFNPAFLVPERRADLIGIIKHELVHYHLHLAHRGYQHRDADFKKLLQQVGGTRYAPPLVTTKSWRYLYDCSHCGQQYPRYKRINTKRYVCGKCGGKLILKQQLT